MWSTGLDRAVSGIRHASFYQVTGQSSDATAGDRSISRQDQTPPAWLRVIPPPHRTLNPAPDGAGTDDATQLGYADSAPFTFVPYVAYMPDLGCACVPRCVPEDSSPPLPTTAGRRASEWRSPNIGGYAMPRSILGRERCAEAPTRAASGRAVPRAARSESDIGRKMRALRCVPWSMGINPHMRYDAGKAATDEVTASLRRTEMTREAMRRAERAEQDVVSARAPRRRHRLAWLFGQLST